MKNDWVWECWGIYTGKGFVSSYFRAKPFSSINIPTFSTPVILHTYPHMKMEQSVPKRRHIKFRRRGITQKKAHNIQNTAKVWNQESFKFVAAGRELDTPDLGRKVRIKYTSRQIVESIESWSWTSFGLLSVASVQPCNGHSVATTTHRQTALNSSHSVTRAT
jgi:hypothetical protein